MYNYGLNRVVRNSVIGDAEVLATKLRQSDTDEVFAAHARTPLQALEGSFNNSLECWSITIDKEVVAMFDVGKTLNPKSGLIWLLASDEILPHSRQFLRGGQQWISKLSSDYDVIYNFVDARNTVSIRWLSWLNFEFVECSPYGSQQLDFWLVAKFKNQVLRDKYIKLYNNRNS